MTLSQLPLGTQVLVGFLLGAVVSLFNYVISNRAIREWVEAEAEPPEKPVLPVNLAVRYFVRYGTNFFAIYTVFIMTSGGLSPLIATAIGLLIMRNYFLVREYLKGKES